MDPITIIKLLTGKGLSPQQIIAQMGNNNPMINNLVRLMNEGKTGDIQAFARNVFKEQGRDFDKEFEEFKRNFQ